MKLSKLALSNGPFKWIILALTVAAFDYMAYWFIGFSVQVFFKMFF